MKLAYLMKPEVDVKRVAPPGSDYIRITMRPDRTWDPKDLELLRDREAILTWKDLVTEEVIKAAPNLKIVQRFGAGYEVLEGCLAITRERGIYCCNLEGVNKESVGEHGMMMILAVARRLMSMHDHVRNARWPMTLTPDNPTFELVGKTLGIIGLGNTGSELAKRARAFEMKIIYNDVREIDPKLVGSLDAVFAKKEELYRRSDIVSINTDLNASTRNLITARELGMMKRSAVFICCARGGIVDQGALAEALNADRLYGAGIDVYDPEPVRPDNPLLSARNIVLTPHIAGVNGDTMKRHYGWAHENVMRVLLHGERPRWVVNGL